MPDTIWTKDTLDTALRSVEKKNFVAETNNPVLFKTTDYTYNTHVGSFWWSKNVMNILPDSYGIFDFNIFQNLGKHASFFSELYFSELEAWTAHELGHVPRLVNAQNNEGLVALGINYMGDKRFRIDFEREADLEAYKRGFGFELAIAAKKSFVSKHLPKEYRKLEDLYMQPWDVVEEYAPKILTKSVYEDILNANSIEKLNAFYDLKK